MAGCCAAKALDFRMSPDFSDKAFYCGNILCQEEISLEMARKPMG